MTVNGHTCLPSGLDVRLRGDTALVLSIPAELGTRPTLAAGPIVRALWPALSGKASVH